MKVCAPWSETAWTALIGAPSDGTRIAHAVGTGDTASVEYVRPAAGNNSWVTSFIWGQNYKLDDHGRTNAVLAETVVPFGRRNFVTGRFEWSERDELFEYDHELAHRVTASTSRGALPGETRTSAQHC